jgi:cytochrome c553
VGPDLAGTKDWPDDKLQAAVKGMEKTVGPLSPDEVNNLVDYLKHSDSSASSKTSEASSSTDNSKTSADTKTSTDTSTASANTDNSSKNEQPKEDEAIVIGSALEGEMLFDGRKSFVNGGMSCNACHSVEGNGSGLGPDLTNISEKMNDKALLASCQQTPFKVMKAAYANHPVSKEEAANLVKYFDSIKGRQAHPEKFSVSLAGGAGSLIILLLVAVGYRNRNSGVRKKLHRR